MLGESHKKQAKLKLAALDGIKEAASDGRDIPVLDPEADSGKKRGCRFDIDMLMAGKAQVRGKVGKGFPIVEVNGFPGGDVGQVERQTPDSGIGFAQLHGVGKEHEVGKFIELKPFHAVLGEAAALIADDRNF